MKSNSHIFREAKKDPSVQVDEYLKSLSKDQIQTLTLRCVELLDKWNEPQGSDTVLRVRYVVDNDERFLKFLRKTVPLVEPKPRDMGAHTFIQHFFDPPFDVEEFIGKMAKEKGIPFTQAEAEWERSKLDKTHVGRYAHMLADDAASGRPPSKEGTNPKEVAIYTAIYDYAKELVADADVVESEVMLHANSAYVGGKFDLLMKKGDEWILVDWKTEGDGSNLDDVSTGKMGIDELTKGMNNNHYNKYALQLNVYEWAAKDGGKIPKDAKVRKELHQFKYLADGQPVKIKVVQVPDMQDLVQKMVEKAIQDGTIKKKDLNNEPNEVKTRMKRIKKESVQKNWHGIPDATFIDNGSQSEPEVEYRGVTLEYADVDDNLWNVYQEEHPEDANGRYFPEWVDENPRYVELVLEELYDKMTSDAEQMDEALEEDLLGMADREDELVWMIQEKFWDLADESDPDTLRELIENCVELEKVKPGKLDEIINEEF